MKNKAFNLNNIRMVEPLGLYNKENLIYPKNYQLVCYFLEKINYSLQDIQEESNKAPNIHSLICLIVFTCWVQESINEIKKCYKPNILKKFSYNNELLKENDSFLKAIRSFIFAHPLNTNRHKKYGFDGTLRCIDIRPSNKGVGFPTTSMPPKQYINTKGLTKFDKQPIDYWIFTYNDNYCETTLYQLIGFSTDTIYKIVYDYIDFLYKFDDFLSKENRGDGK